LGQEGAHSIFKGYLQYSLVALRKYGKQWHLIQHEVPTRTVIQIRTHSQKFFERVKSAAPANKDLMDFVRESPLEYFITLTGNESLKEESKISLKSEKETLKEKEQSLKIYNKVVPPIKRQPLSYLVNALRLLSVNGNLGIVRFNIQSIITAAYNNIEHKPIPNHWACLYKAAVRMNKLLEKLKDLHYKSFNASFSRECAVTE